MTNLSPNKISNKINFTDIKINLTYFPNIKERLIILETIKTGPNPKSNNIMEIGCIEMKGGKITGSEFQAYIHPRYFINEITKQSTNLSKNFFDDFYKDKDIYETDRQTLENLKFFIGNSRIVTHDASKEIEFLNNEFSFHKIKIYSKMKFFSTLETMKNIFNINKLPLNNSCKYLNIKIPQESFHTAKYLVFMEAKLMSKIFEILNEIIEKNNNKENLSNVITKSDAQNSSDLKTFNNINLVKNNKNEVNKSDIKSISLNEINDNEFDNIIELFEENEFSNDITKKEKKIEEKEEKDLEFLNSKRKNNSNFNELLDSLLKKVKPKQEEEIVNGNAENIKSS